jgi:hypothetical protein
VLFLTNICSLKRGRKRERVCLFFQIQSSKREEERKRKRDLFIWIALYPILYTFYFLKKKKNLVLDNFFTEFEQCLMCMLTGLVCLNYNDG